MLGVFDAVLARHTCSLEIGGVHLHSRFIRKHFEQYAGFRRIQRCGHGRVVALAVLVRVQAPVVVVT